MSYDLKQNNQQAVPERSPKSSAINLAVKTFDYLLE